MNYTYGENVPNVFVLFFNAFTFNVNKEVSAVDMLDDGTLVRNTDNNEFYTEFDGIEQEILAFGRQVLTNIVVEPPRIEEEGSEDERQTASSRGSRRSQLSSTSSLSSRATVFIQSIAGLDEDYQRFLRNQLADCGDGGGASAGVGTRSPVPATMEMVDSDSQSYSLVTSTPKRVTQRGEEKAAAEAIAEANILSPPRTAQSLGVGGPPQRPQLGDVEDVFQQIGSILGYYESIGNGDAKSLMDQARSVRERSVRNQPIGGSGETPLMRLQRILQTAQDRFGGGGGSSSSSSLVSAQELGAVLGAVQQKDSDMTGRGYTRRRVTFRRRR